MGKGGPAGISNAPRWRCDYLGETLDIHTGGIDLAFPHHENEIAESESATGKQFVRFWLHAEHLLVDGQKMSKSLGNFYTLRDLFAQGYKPSSIRLLLASVPYRQSTKFYDGGLQQANSSVERLRNLWSDCARRNSRSRTARILPREFARPKKDFDARLADDLNTAQALAAIFDLVSDANIAMDKGEFSARDAAEVLGGTGGIRRHLQRAGERRRPSGCACSVSRRKLPGLRTPKWRN